MRCATASQHLGPAGWAPLDTSYQKLQPGHETVSTYFQPLVHKRTELDRAQAHTQQQTLVDTRCRPTGASGTGLQQMRVSSCTSTQGRVQGRRVRARVGARVTAAHLLQCFTDAVDTLHSNSRSCKSHRSSTLQCLCDRRARRSENRACEARGSVGSVCQRRYAYERKLYYHNDHTPHAKGTRQQ